MKALLVGLKDDREDYIDVMRGLAICLIVLGHTVSPITHLLYLFHVAVFYILSGACFKNASTYKPREILVGKIKRLYVPYIVYNTLFILLNNVFIVLGFYSNGINENLSKYNYNISHYFTFSETMIEILKVLLFSGGSSMAGALWFLRSLFIASITYGILYYISLKIKSYQSMSRIAMCIIISILGYISVLNGFHIPYNVQCSFVVIVLFEIGHWFRLKKSLFDKPRFYYLTPITTVCILLICNSFCTIDIGRNIYTTYIMFVFLSCVGFLFLFYLSKLILRNKRLSSLFMWLGKISLHIMALHFIAFKLISVLVIQAYSLEPYCLAVFPTIAIGTSWLFYWGIGLLISCLLISIFSRSRKAMVERRFCK